MNWFNNFFITDTSHLQVMLGVYNYWLVAISIILAIASSFFSLHLATVAQYIVAKTLRITVLISGAIIMAAGVWSMHFLGMLAYNMGHAVSYDVWLTALSVLPSIVASYITLTILVKPSITLKHLIISGTLVGAGIGCMHYLGMAAMQMNVTLRYDPYWFALSIIVAVGLAIISLSARYYVIQFKRHWSITWINILSAVIMGASISGMHYTGMTGAIFIQYAPADLLLNYENQNNILAISIAITALLISTLATNVTTQLRYRQLIVEKATNELRLKTTLNTAIDGIITIDHKGLIQEFNKAAINIFGWKEQEVVGKNISMLMPNPYKKEHNGYLSAFHKTGVKKIIGSAQEVTALHKEGHTFPIRLAVGQVDIEGYDPLFVGFVTDISERRAMEDKIKKSEEQYSSLMRNIQGASFRYLLCEELQLIFVSDAIFNLTGWNANDFYNKQIVLLQLKHPDDRSRVLSTIHKARETKSTYSVEYRLQHKDGHYIWALETGSIVMDENDEPKWLDAFILDITPRIEMEESLRRAKHKAELSAESKSTFLANMSHEIRTPMNAIIGFTDILLESELPLGSKKHLSVISKSARSLLHLLNDILDSAKLEKNKLDLEQRTFELVSTIDTVISTLWLQAKSKDIDLSFTIKPEVGKSYYGAEDRIHQVLMNIIGNSIKFTEQGKVTLTVSKNEQGHLLFAIEDTGIGIEQERLDSIFEPFTQADASMSRRFGGTGLGTTISKQLVNLMGGEIKATSEVGVGSCFYFNLPLEEKEITTNKVTKKVLKLTPKKVLIADDIEQNLTLLDIILKRQGHAICMANDGAIAVEQFKKYKPDIILMDIQMPVMDGLTATKAIREYEAKYDLPQTPVVALTANVLTEDRVEAQKAGMNGFANKPIDINALTQEMARVLNTDLIVEEHSDQKNSVHLQKKQIHISKALDLWGDETVYLTELNRFLDTNKPLISLLQSQVKERNYSDIMQRAHSIKGSSSNLALMEISQQANDLEGAAKIENHADCSVAIERLAQEIQAFTLELDKLNEANPLPAKETAEATPLSATAQEIYIAIEELLELTHAGEIDDDKIDWLVDNITLDLKDKATKIKNAIDDFEFDIAIKTLDELKDLIEVDK